MLPFQPWNGSIILEYIHCKNKFPQNQILNENPLFFLYLILYVVMHI